MILAGDFGGTKCSLALFDMSSGTLRRVAQRRFASKDFSRVEDIVKEFLREAEGEITAAGFGAAGLVSGQRVRGTNLPWLVDGASLASLVGLERVMLLNDLEAVAYSLQLLHPTELCVLNQGTPAPQSNKALIAAGTGLGEAIMFWDGQRHVASATEGGHADFAPRTEQEIELLRYLKKQHGAVGVEHILSGRGFRALHEFLDPAARHPSFETLETDPAPEITSLGLSGACPVCIQSLDLWTAIYGAEAGNLALRALARGGVYVAGGIAVKILPKLKDGTFFRSFCAKSEFVSLLQQVPIFVVLNEEAPVLGAAAQAAKFLGQ